MNVVLKTTYVSATEEVYDRLMTLLGADDEQGLSQLRIVGTVFLVASGTKAKVISKSWGKVEVRIAQGESGYSGRSGFVPASAVSSQR